MSVTVSTELYVQATPEQVARALAPHRTGDLTIALTGSWHLAAWSPSTDSWRHDVTWRRGRGGGTGTVDLLPADAERTLVIVSLTTRPRSLRRGRPADAAAIARQLRAAAERGDTATATARTAGQATGSRADHPVGTAVGYSGP